MKHKSKRRLIMLSMAGVTGLAAGLSFMQSVPVHADSVPSNVAVKNPAKTDKSFSYSTGALTYASSNWGTHFVDGIKDTSGNYLFCVQWSKNAPANTTIAAKVQADPAVTWLVNDFAKGASKRYQSLGKGDKGDYWLYQSVIHWITEPGDKDGANGYNIQHFFDKPGLDAGVQKKIKALHTEALKQAKAGTTEEVLNTHAMSFSPEKLVMNGDSLKGDNYTKGFKFNSTSMDNVKVWLDGAPKGTKLSGSGVNLNDVKNGANINLSMPYREGANGKKSFHVKAKGDWTKQLKVAYIYGDSKNVNQDVAKQVVKATTVPLDVTANMDVEVNPATGKITFTKKGSANNNSQVLAGTQFELTASGVSKTATADSKGVVTFDNLPLGKDYKIKEIKQPNKYYTGDLSSYNTTVTALNGSNPTLNAKAWGGNLLNVQSHHDINIQKEDNGGGPLVGAQFVLVQVPKGQGFKGSVADAKKQAMHQSGDYVVGGDNGGKPVTATSNSNGVASFKLVETNANRYDYYAVEVKAPDGYQLSLEPTKLSVNATGPNVLESTVKDNGKTPMPATGSDQMLYYLIGAGGLLFVGSGAYVIKLRGQRN